MKELSATEAARHFADVLDGVEYEGETYVIARHGRAVARVEPVGTGNGAKVMDVLRSFKDEAWPAELAQLRRDLPVQERDWND